MNDFSIFFEQGYHHILNWSALDHILFVTVLCLRYQFNDWRKVILLITAFTIGHCITLALSVFNIIHYSTTWIEFLIPVTIVITALTNLSVKKFVFKSRFPVIYFLALFFGLVHGLGFSSYLKSMLGRDRSVVVELLAFNLGLEGGQLLIVTGVLLISFIFVTILKCNRREYLLFLTGGIFAFALQMAIERIPK
ncbi:MAG: HupE/UreJ family protein [Sediminibacterium sp.]|nr:HupE/UreJ family protein [Sediminibacterium sp.]